MSEQQILKEEICAISITDTLWEKVRSKGLKNNISEIVVSENMMINTESYGKYK